MAELMGDNILNTAFGHLKKAFVECYDAFFGHATAPTGFHGSQTQNGHFNSVLPNNRVLSSQKFDKNGFHTLSPLSMNLC